MRKRFRSTGVFVPLMALLWVCMSACAGMYFRDAGMPPDAYSGLDLNKSPHQEYWTGIILGGDKIGFSHFKLEAATDAPDRIEIASEAAFSFRFLMVEKKFSLKSYDRMRQDLTMESFAYDYNIDGSTMQLKGELKDGTLHVTTQA